MVPQMSSAPKHVLARLGPRPDDLGRLGSSRVLRGNGLILKEGAPDGASREALAIGLVSACGLVNVPRFVDAGPGWVLLEAVEGRPWRSSPAPLAALASMHARFEEAPELEDSRLRDV